MLRPIEISDLDLILSWRNEPSVRKAMFNQHEITKEEHYEWFERMKSNPDSKWFIYLNNVGIPNGVVYFTSLNMTHRTAFWGFYSSPSSTLGTGLRIALDALEIAFNKIGLLKLNGEVISNNKRSIQMHKSVGFKEEGIFRNQLLIESEGFDVIRFGILSNEWPEKRAILKNRIYELDTLLKAQDGHPPPRNIE